MGTPEAQAHSSLFPTKEKIQDGILSARRFTWRMLERKDVRSFKSVLLMVDVLFVMVSIQSQLDASRERIVGAVLVKDLQPHAPDPQTILHHVPLLRHLPGVQAEAGKFSHMQKAIFFKYEELFTLSASLSILTMLLVEKLARIWARGERWYRRVSEVVDLGVIALSIGFEWIFHTMEHDGSLKSLKGSVLRWVTENWRFVRIVHGSYETLAHSPIVAPMLKGT